VQRAFGNRGITIEFATSLHKPVTRTLALQNASKSEICYRATYEGNPNFVFQIEQIDIGPGQSAEFPVTFLARSVRPVTGRLQLMGSRPRVPTASSAMALDTESLSEEGEHRVPLYSAPVVVDFLSNVTVAAPNVSLRMEGPIYRVTKQVVNVLNILGMPATMAISLRITRIQDETGRGCRNPECSIANRSILTFCGNM
jgi:hypothetical protein